jgi:PAS domain S-box-containing protein
MGMRVGDLARRTGMGVSTLRAWERRFNFPQPQRSAAGHRLYEEADVELIGAVARLIGEGLTLPAAIARVATVGPAALPAGEGEALLFGQILQAAEQGIWVTRDGRTRYANRRMAEIMGYSIEELLAIPVLEFFEPHVLPIIRERAALVRTGQRLHVTETLRRAGGSTFLAEIDTTPLLNQAGRYEGAVSMVTDITTRHAAEAQSRLRATVLDSIGEAVAVTAPDGTILYVNAAAERLFGWRAADVIGKDGNGVFYTPDDAKRRERIRKSLREGRSYTGRLSMSRHDGGQFAAQVTAASILDERGTVVGFVAVMRDQTKPDQLEKSAQTRGIEVETLAVLGTHALRQRADPGHARLIMTEVAEATRRLFGADRVMVLEMIADGNELEVRVASPRTDERITVPFGSGSFAGYVALAGKVVIVEDMNLDQRFDPYPGRQTASAIGAPIFGPFGVYGVLTVESSTPNRFDHTAHHFIQGMTNIIGTSLLR